MKKKEFKKLLEDNVGLEEYIEKEVSKRSKKVKTSAQELNDLKVQIATLTKTLEEEKNKTLKKEKEIAKEQKEIFMDKIIKDLEFLPKGAKLFKIENGDMIHQVNGKFRVGEFKDGIFVDLKDDAGKIITPEVFLKKEAKTKSMKHY